LRIQQVGGTIASIPVDVNPPGNQVEPISDLLVSRADAAEVTIDVVGGNLVVGQIDSANNAALSATGSILDAFADIDDDFARNVRAGGDVSLSGLGMGTIDNYLDVNVAGNFSAIATGNSTTGNIFILSQNGLSATDADLNVANITSANGDVVLEVLGATNINQISALNGTLALLSLNDINNVRGDGDAAIAADVIVLNSQTGAIGSTTEALTIDSGITAASVVTAEASQSIFLTETTGNLRLNTIASDGAEPTNADVTLLAEGNILDGNAAPDPVQVTGLALSDLGITPLTPTDLNVVGVTINLTSSNGSVGTSSDAIEIDSSSVAPGQFNSFNTLNEVYVTEVAGPLNLGQVLTQIGNIGLSVRDSAATGENLVLDATAQIATEGGSIALKVGDDALFTEGSLVSALVGITLEGDLGDTGNNDSQGSILDIYGTMQVAAVDGNGADVLSNGITLYGNTETDTITLSPTTLIGHTRVLSGDGDDTVTLDQLPTLTTTHLRNDTNPDTPTDRRVRDTVDVDGQEGADNVIVNIAATPAGAADPTTYLVNVVDSGNPSTSVDSLTINTTDNNDLVLMRQHFVAFLTADTPLTAGETPGTINANFERINYDQSINDLRVNTGLGDDQVYVDDNSAIATVDLSQGKDLIQVGQVFGTNPNLSVAEDIDGIDLTAAGDTIDLNPPITRGFLSKGVTHPLTVYGGEDSDTFSVYSNKAQLRLEGESGNDVFTIRSFQFDASTIINGGDGDDLIEYNVNAPVNINGGNGFDTVVALGSEGDDTFIVSDTGVRGANLDIKLDGVEESVEVDGLEGNDTFFILSTLDNTVTKVIGGLGSDTFNLGGDVTEAVISQSLEGRNGVINHGSLSADARYDQLLVDSLTLNVAAAQQGKVVITQLDPATEQEDGRTVLTENAAADAFGAIDLYSLQMSVPSTTVDAGTVAYLTVSAALASASDRRLPTRTLEQSG
jgi:hypothetical protein